MVTGFFALRVKNLVTFYFLVTKNFFPGGGKSCQIFFYFFFFGGKIFYPKGKKFTGCYIFYSQCMCFSNYGIIRDLPGGRHYRTIVSEKPITIDYKKRFYV